ncbi:MAG TPA: type IX secretion system outer membrane channel protein PorV [Saprospiraceae bacterium]|nr:type IX secretion system outer membrane channel protein PorV [Saprospiraceae bacterium]HPG06595.1 type IX secretion system outer membrane channel protein PorV [Saprospiraceae bacterium]HRV83644.1 type IX secretion system outer membrane channel protein PorV [Saprospiraceae bacterium]
MMKQLLFVFLGIMLTGAQAYGQCIPRDPANPSLGYILPDGSPCPNAIITAVPFLMITPDARSGAMGDVGIAISPDANSMAFNSSKLAFVDESSSLSATYSPWLRALGLRDVYMAYLSGYKKINELQSVGASLRFFSLGDIDFTDENGEPAGQGQPNEFELSAAYARKLSEKFSAGLTMKFIYSNLAANQVVEGRDIKAGLAGAADLSFSYISPVDNGTIRAGLALRNLGTKISYTQDVNDFIPANFGLGFAYDIDLDDFNSLTVAVDMNKLMVPTPPYSGSTDYKKKSVVSSWFSSFGDGIDFSEELHEINYSIGAEYWYDKQFAVRLGYFYEHPTKGARNYLTVGLGVKYNVFGLNLSYLVPTSNQRNPLDNTLRFGLVFDFGGE